MNLLLEYREMSLLRDILRNKRCDLFQKLPIKKGIDYREARKKFETIKNPFCEIGLVNVLLGKIDKIEEEIQNQL